MDVNDDSQDEKLQYVFKHRGPTFSPEEVNILIDFIEKHKTIILNKSLNTMACQTKEATWRKIANAYNNCGFNERTIEGLKMKWDNMKKIARKVSKNLLDIRYDDYNDVTKRVVALLCEAEGGTFNSTENPDDIELPKSSDTKDILWGEDDEKLAQETLDMSNSTFDSRYRSMNFTPRECSLLLKCVKAEKEFIFNKENTGKANRLKYMAWKRVADTFNSNNPNKRPMKVLHTKFSNIKKMANRVVVKRPARMTKKNTNVHIGEQANTNNIDIKVEPLFDEDVETSQDDNFDSLHNGFDHTNIPHDPLSNVLNGDSDTDNLNNINCSVNTENKEVVKLKMELLKFQMETAKLERQRVKEAMEVEAAERESRATETALRLRAARLELVAAELKLPANHPELRFSSAESPAQRYLENLS